MLPSRKSRSFWICRGLRLWAGRLRHGAVLVILGMLLALTGTAGQSLFASSVSAQTTAANLVVSVGYADNLRANPLFPSPWDGSPNTTFIGQGPTYDSGALLLQDTSSTAISVSDVSVQVGTSTFDLWGSSLTVPANGNLILTQTSGSQNFDTSDVGGVSNCTPDGVYPTVTMTIGGTAYPYTDTQQILNTGGIDPGGSGSCGTYNESHPWAVIGSQQLAASTEFGSGNLVAPQIRQACVGKPVDCATGNFTETFDELSIPGRGVPLQFDLTYNGLGAANQSVVGYGWSSTYGTSLAVDSTTGTATVTEPDGSTVTFTQSSGAWVAPAWAQATLTQNSNGTYTFDDQTQQVLYLYSSSGQLLSETDRNGYVTSCTYNSSGQLSQVTDPAGRSLTFSYNGQGELASVTDPAGRTVTLAYDSAGDLTSITDPAGKATTFTYDSAHHLLSRTDPLGNVLSNSYNSQGQVLSQTDPLGGKTTLSYSDGTTTITDPNGNVTQETFSDLEPTSMTKGVGTSAQATWVYRYDPVTLGMTSATDPNGNTTTMTYDSRGNLLSVTDSLGRVTSYTYNSRNQVTSATDPEGVTTTYTYNSDGDLTGISTPLTSTGQVQTTTLTYGDSSQPGDVTAVTNPDGKKWTFAYDSQGDLVSTTDPLGDTTTAAYNVIGEMTSSVSAQGNVSGGSPSSYTTTYSYNALGETTGVTNPLGATTSYTYDADGNLISTTNASSQTTTYSYDANSQLVKTVEPGSITIAYGYDPAGNLTSVTNGAGQATSYGYNALNRLTSETNPLGQIWTLAYDGAGNQTSLTNPSGQVTSYTYDAANELSGISYSSGQASVSMSYTLDGQLASMTDGTGTSTYSYDSLGRLTQDVNGAGQAVSYGYDLAGNLTSLTYPDGHQVTRSYDPASQLTSVSDWLGNTTKFSYTADGMVSTESYPNGVQAQSTYNQADQATGITDTQGSSTLASFSYTRNPLALVTGASQSGVGQGSQSYTYTGLDQLASWNGASYQYDGAGNPTALPGGTSLSYNSGSQLTTTTQAGVTSHYTYSAEGNRTSGPNPLGGSNTYSFNQANQLTGVTTPKRQGVIAGGWFHTLAVNQNGTVSAWGDNGDGQLGNGTTTSSTTPVQVSNLSGVEAVSANGYYSMALKSNGTVWDWGYGGDGNLGNGSTSNSTTPVEVSNLSGVVAIAAGCDHGLALTSSGTVYAWGDNSYGQLGNGTTTNSSTPVAVSGLSGVVAIAAGCDHSLALTSSGAVYAWGYNHDGQLGDGSTRNSSTPVEVSGVSNVTSIAAGEDFSLAVESGGTAWAWGNNGYGQLGDGSTKNSSTPVEVSGISNVVMLAGGGFHTVALTTSGAVYAWGYNKYGQLGDGTTTNSYTPVQVSNLSGAVTVAAGVDHSIAATGGAAVWDWGNNQYGQLGNGSTSESDVPVQPTSLGSVDTQTTATYTYDGTGLRATKTVNGTTSHFAYDLSSGTPLILTDGTTDYVYGPGGLPIEQVTGSGSPIYLSQDQLGSTRLLTNSSGAVVGTYSYDPAGNITSETGTATTNLLFAGQYLDQESGLYWMRARYYDPTTSQFISMDPLNTGATSPYSYASGNPVNMIDPTGELDSNVFLQCSHTPGSSQCVALANAAVAANANGICLRDFWAGNNGNGGCQTALSTTQAGTDIGIALGAGATIATLGGFALPEGAGVFGLEAGTQSAGVLKAVAVVAGAAAGLADLPGCLHGNVGACLAGGLGVAGGAFGAGGPALQFFGGTIGMFGLGFDTVFNVFQVNAMARSSRVAFPTPCGQLG